MKKLKIESALISVFNKEGISEVCMALFRKEITIYSTGGTKKFIENLDIPVKSVESLTGYPSILGGRVKTLHPKIFGSILSRSSNKQDLIDQKTHDIPKINLVIVDLYPFSDTLKKTDEVDEIIEKIDIGGVSLIRAAAKNYKSVLCISSKSQYEDLINLLDKDAGSSIITRKEFATKAFENTMNYDSEISKYFNNTSLIKKKLRYGENPHQEGVFIGDINKNLNQLHGKEISFNNLLDIDSAINLIKDLSFEENVFAILKHNNPCGVAIRSKLVDAYKDSLSSDNVSAFGGVLVTNSKIDFETANEIVIPTNRSVRLKLLSDTVIHSFWVPALAGKVDMLPGRENYLVLKANEEGEFRGQCAEFCGTQHALMSFYVRAMAQDEYLKWKTNMKEMFLHLL